MGDHMSTLTHDNWGVAVFVDGVPILTIEVNCLSGRDLSEMDRATIAMAADHLLSFVGLPAPSPATSQPDPVTEAARETIIDTIEEIISKTCEIDVTHRKYAEGVVSWLALHHPRVLHILAGEVT